MNRLGQYLWRKAPSLLLTQLLLLFWLDKKRHKKHLLSYDIWEASITAADAAVVTLLVGSKTAQEAPTLLRYLGSDWGKFYG